MCIAWIARNDKPFPLAAIQEMGRLRLDGHHHFSIAIAQTSGVVVSRGITPTQATDLREHYGNPLTVLMARRFSDRWNNYERAYMGPWPVSPDIPSRLTTGLHMSSVLFTLGPGKAVARKGQLIKPEIINHYYEQGEGITPNRIVAQLAAIPWRYDACPSSSDLADMMGMPVIIVNKLDDDQQDEFSCDYSTRGPCERLGEGVVRLCA